MQTIRDAFEKACEMRDLRVFSKKDSTKIVITSGKESMPKKVTIPASPPNKPMKWMIGRDLIDCAQKRNNVLTQSVYEQAGKYSIAQVMEAYGSFKAACLEHNILNPENIDDYEKIIEDIKQVAAMYNGKMSPEIYQAEGIYSYEAIDKKYGFHNILVDEGFIPRDIRYRIYPLKRESRSSILSWNYTYQKQFYGI